MNLDTPSTDAIERMADLVRRQHPSLDTMLLPPNGKFQTRTVALDTMTDELTDCLAEAFRHRATEDFPMLYFAWGKCRVGSTPLTNLFGMVGMPSYYQPLKAMLRDAQVGHPLTAWTICVVDRAAAYLQQGNLRPVHPGRKPVHAPAPLIEAGYPPHKVHFIMLDRDPASSLASWLDKLRDRAPANTLIHNYVIAVLNTLRVESYAARQGIPVTHYFYEASKEAVASVRVLFDRLGLSSHFADDAVTDWGKTGQLHSESSRIIFPDEPELYKPADLH